MFFHAAPILIMAAAAALPALSTTSGLAQPLVSTSLREHFEPPLDLLLASRVPSALSSAAHLWATKFEAIVVHRSTPTHSLEFDARRFAPALFSRQELLASHGINDVPIDVVDLVRLRWSSTPPSTQPVRVHINLERGVSNILKILSFYYFFY